MPTPADMVTQLEAALAESPAGVVEVQTPDGQRTKWDRDQVLRELAYWQRRAAADAAKDAGRSSLAGRFTTIDISGGMR